MLVIVKLCVPDLNKVHDIRPPFQRYHEEYGDPGQTNVVKRDGTMEWVGGAGGAPGVILR